MSFEEASYIVDKSENDYIDGWEKIRQIVFSVYQSQSTKKLNITEVLPFSWDKKTQDESNLPVKTKEELIQHAKEMERILNEKNK